MYSFILDVLIYIGCANDYVDGGYKFHDMQLLCPEYIYSHKPFSIFQPISTCTSTKTKNHG